MQSPQKVTLHWILTRPEKEYEGIVNEVAIEVIINHSDVPEWVKVIEPVFADKIVEIWHISTRIAEAKAGISDKGTLLKYT